MEILLDIRNHIAFLTLNRPAALNALSRDMLGELAATMRTCADDPAVYAVLIQGAGEKAFCAGGDVRALYQSYLDGGTLHEEFFTEEYRLDYFLHRYRKPYVALMDGIVMGGGMGIAQGAGIRIVGERTRMAMPEVGIGLFPDVGASYFLSRLPGSLGVYLALTGTTLRAADALYAELADFFLPRSQVLRLIQNLEQLVWSEEPRADVGLAIRKLAADEPTPGTRAAGTHEAPLRALRPAIDAHFGQPTVAGILDSLSREVRPEFAEWAEQTARLMNTRSPLMSAVTLEQLKRGRTLTLAQCFRMELGMVRECFASGEFIEGIRALIIDKDNAPRWRPARREDVTTAMVEAFFRERWPDAAAHPLGSLESDYGSLG